MRDYAFGFVPRVLDANRRQQQEIAMEMPAIASGTYSSQALALNAIGQAGGVEPFKQAELAQMMQLRNQPFPEAKQEKAVMANQRRLVQVFVADPNDNVPLDQCLLYSGEQKLTDLTDLELFFEIEIKSILDAHNAKRAKLINKAIKERTEYLEPARIRDLKMTVVTIAQF